MNINDKMSTSYLNAKELVKQNNPKAASDYIICLLQYAKEMYNSATSIMQQVKIKIFMENWAAVAAELQTKGITDFVLRCFKLPTKRETAPPKVAKSSKGGYVAPKQGKIAEPPTHNGDIDLSGLIDYVSQSQGWCAQVFESNRAAIVEIHVMSSGSQGNGTGFIISKNGYLLTNDHVVFDEANGNYYSKIVMSFIGENKAHKLEVIFSDKKSDVALCKFDPAGMPPFTGVKIIENYATVKQGADCLVIGNAFGQGLAPFTGIVRYTHNDSGDLVYTAPSNPGDSGGPVFNRQGECIGMNKSKTITINGTAADGYANATPMDTIQGLLNKWGQYNNIDL